MKCRFCALAALLVLLCGFADARHPSESGDAKQDWGPIEKGVRAGLTVDKLIYPVGEDVPLHIMVENVLATHPLYGGPFRPRTAFGYDDSDGIQVTVQNEDGSLNPRNALRIAEGGGPLVCPAPYLLGRPVRIEKTLRKAGLLPSTPGTYKVTVTWSPFTTDITDCMAAPHFNPAAPPEMPYVSVTSNPVVLQITGEPSSSEKWPVLPEYTAWKKHFSLIDSSFGEKTALLDKRTHLEWLRLNLTAGLSYNQVRAELAPERRFAGWRYATPEELRLFFAHFTGSATGRSNNPVIERKFQRLLGGPLNEVSNPATGWHRRDSYGFVGDPAGPDNSMIHYHAGYLTEESDGFDINPDTGGSFAPGTTNAGWGSFLVRRSGGPHPAANPLFSIAIRPTKDVVKADSEVRIDIILTNTSSHEIVIGECGVAAWGHYKIEVQDSYGKPVPKTAWYKWVTGECPPSKVCVQTSSPQVLCLHQAPHQILRPGEFLKEEIDVNKLYDLSQPGKYTIQISRVNDPRTFFTVPGKFNSSRDIEMDDKMNDVSRGTALSNTVIVTVEPGPGPTAPSCD
jgi:hypothetical protein